MLYVNHGDEGARKENKVRVNCKINPSDTNISTPQQWRDERSHVKSTLIKYKRGTHKYQAHGEMWHLIEDRVPVEQYCVPEEPCSHMVIFTQEKRMSSTGVAYRATLLTEMFDDENKTK